jgi:hypothetical protein
MRIQDGKNSDPGSGMEKLGSGIRDGQNSDPGSGINIAGSATLGNCRKILSYICVDVRVCCYSDHLREQRGNAQHSGEHMRGGRAGKEGPHPPDTLP